MWRDWVKALGPTGNPDCPPWVINAKRVQRDILDSLEASDIDDEEEKEEEEEETPKKVKKRKLTTTTTRNRQGISNTFKQLAGAIEKTGDSSQFLVIQTIDELRTKDGQNPCYFEAWE